jgi:electron transfer flavoprotein alpha subunit
MPKVLVVAETKNGELKKPTLELLSLAKSMNLQAVLENGSCLNRFCTFFSGTSSE